MTRLNVMKNSIISQIKQMSVEDFECFMNIIENSCDDNPENPIILDQSTLTCKKCEMIYGKCPKDDDERCYKRFIQYASEEI